MVPVEEYYYGYARDLYPDLEISAKDWSEQFINKLSNDKRFNMECDSPDCNNKVPHEGIVIKVENMKSEAAKLKSFRFLDKEQAITEANIEDEN